MSSSSRRPGSRSKSRGSSRGRGSISPSRGGKNKEKGESYAEREIWSCRFRAWTRYDVKKPRLPTDEDKVDWIESFRGRPTTLNGLLGKSNDAACRTLQQYLDQFEGSKNLQDLNIIYGPAGSGKSILAQIYVTTMGEDLLDLSSSQFNKWSMSCDAKKYDASNYHELWKKIKDFIEVPMDSKAIRIPFKVIILDDADTISATHQNSMKTLMDKNTMKLKWIFTAREPRKFIQYLQTKAVMTTCKAPSEKEALMIILSFCHRFKIGFERSGMKCLFQLAATMSKQQHSKQSQQQSGSSNQIVNLTEIFRLLQKCFLTRHYISEDNVYMAAGKSRPKVVVGPYAAIEPLERCRICTLYPPCKHRTLEILTKQAIDRRAALPERKGGLECREFLRSGCCTIFNKHGHCSLDHPKKKVLLKKSQRRCPICTIVWPCNHCTYSNARNNLLKDREEILRRLELLDVLTQKEPPVYLITHLVDKYEGWEDSLKGIKSFYATEEKAQILNDIERWVNEEYSVEIAEYEFKISYLRRVYGEMLVTPLLEERETSRERSRGQSRQRLGPDGNFEDMSIASLDSSITGSLLSVDNKSTSSNSQRLLRK